MKRICINCNQEYEPTTDGQKFCGAKCNPGIYPDQPMHRSYNRQKCWAGINHHGVIVLTGKTPYWDRDVPAWNSHTSAVGAGEWFNSGRRYCRIPWNYLDSIGEHIDDVPHTSIRSKSAT
jgi:hypothetical protein